MKRFFFVLFTSLLFATALLSCSDPATDIKEGEATTADTTQMMAPSTNYPTDTSTPPIVADTMMIPQ